MEELAGETDFGVCDLQSARGQDQRHERCGKQHLQNRDVAFSRLVTFGEGIRRVYTEALGRTNHG